MATSANNSDLKIYNQLNNYCEAAENLTTRIAEDKDISIKQKNEIFYPMIDEIKEMSEELIEKYMLYLKNRNNSKLFDELLEGIDEIVEKIDVFKNKVYEVYRVRDSGRSGR